MKTIKIWCPLCKKETKHTVETVQGIITEEEIKRTCTACKYVSRQPFIRL